MMTPDSVSKGPADLVGFGALGGLYRRQTERRRTWRRRRSVGCVIGTDATRVLRSYTQKVPYTLLFESH